MIGPAVLLLTGLVILAAAIAITFGVIQEPATDLQDVLLKAAAWLGGVYISLQGVWKALPDPLKRLTAAALRKLPTLPNAWKRRVVKNELEGNLNAALKEFSREGAGFIDHEVKIEWLTPDSDAKDLFFRSGKAFLKLGFSENNDRNLVDAALTFCRDGLIPSSRQYVPPPLMRAIDLVFVDEMLERRHAHMSRAYLTQEVIPREVQRFPEADGYIDTLSLISQHGLFTRVFLPELREYTGYVPARMALDRHHHHVIAFMEFLEHTVKSRETRTRTGLIHVGAVVRAAIVLVGIPYKLRLEGTRPYIRAAATHNANGARTVYLLGYNEGVHAIGDIASEAKARGIVSSFEIDEYTAIVGNEVSKHRLARMTMVPGGGVRFLEELANLEEWPDLDTDDDESDQSSDRGPSSGEMETVDGAPTVTGRPE